MLIKDEKLKRALLEAVADREASKILATTINRAMSLRQLVMECGIPHTSAHRLINELKNNKLLMANGMGLIEKGKKPTLYKSTFNKVSITFVDGKVEVDASLNKEGTSKIIEELHRIERRTQLKPERSSD